MHIEYQVNTPIDTDTFVDLLHRSGLGERRPTHDRTCMQGVLQHSNLIVSAWAADRLVGIARSVTDWHYACYLSDLAVCKSQQKSGIGQKLIQLTQAQLGPQCSLILLAAPAAHAYYEHIGFESHPRCWILGPQKTLATVATAPAHTTTAPSLRS